MADTEKAPAEKTTATATETAAAQALKAKEQEGMTKAEIRAAETTKAQEKQADETAQALEDNRDDNELHVTSDLVQAAPRLFGVAPEVAIGACHFAGLEMTQEITAGDLAEHIRSFMDQPA
jgi:hypothetical protein